MRFEEICLVFQYSNNNNFIKFTLYLLFVLISLLWLEVQALVGCNSSFGFKEQKTEQSSGRFYKERNM